MREATSQIPADRRVATALKQQLSWQAMPRPGVRVTDVSSDAAPSCEEGIDGCWTEQIIEGDTTAAMYDPASCDNPGDGGGSSGGGGGSGGGGDDDSPSPFPPTTYPPPSYPDPPPPSHPDPPPSDPPPGGGGAGDCSQQIDPDCPDEDPPGDDDPLIAVADPLFGVVLQDCCIDCPGDTPEVPLNPCESDNPPEYCNEAGSCFDASISNDAHRTILEAMEDQGSLNQLWNDSNFDQPESNRLEQGGFLVPNSFDDGYTFQRLQPSQITQQTPCKLGFQVPSNLPDGTIYVHTHPYENGEQQDYCDTPIPVEYRNEVGVADRPALQQMNLSEGLIIDADKIIFYGASGHEPDGYASYDRCGY